MRISGIFNGEDGEVRDRGCWVQFSLEVETRSKEDENNLIPYCMISYKDSNFCKKIFKDCSEYDWHKIKFPVENNIQ